MCIETEPPTYPMCQEAGNLPLTWLAQLGVHCDDCGAKQNHSPFI